MDYIEKLKNATHVSDRVILATDPECSTEVLAVMAKHDAELEVIKAVANNPSCPADIFQFCIDRLKSMSINYGVDINDTTICPIPWTHLSIQQNGDLRVCCQNIYLPFGQLTSEGKTLNINKDDINEARNHIVLKNLRKSMLNGEKHQLCNLCWKEEDLGLSSKRKLMLKTYPIDDYKSFTQKDGTIDVDKFPIRYIDIRFGNLCNLKCRYCGPVDSSLWVEDYATIANVDEPKMSFYSSNTYEIKKIKDVWKINSSDFEWYEQNNFWEQIKKLIPYIDRYYFTGGEPTINKAHFTLLELISEVGNPQDVSLEYNSNVVAIPEKLFELWKPFKDVSIGCSIDAIDDLANYLRYPSDWNTLKNNLIKIDQAGHNIRGCISSTISVYNIRNFINLTRWLISQPFEHMSKMPAYHMLDRPSAMSVQVLPIRIKKQIKIEYEEFFLEIRNYYNQALENQLRSSFSGILSYMFAEDKTYLLNKLYQKTEELDRIRGQKLKNSIPWLAQVLTERHIKNGG